MALHLPTCTVLFIDPTDWPVFLGDKHLYKGTFCVVVLNMRFRV